MGSDIVAFGLSFAVLALGFIILSKSRKRSTYQERIGRLERYRQQIDARKLAGENVGGSSKMRAYKRNKKKVGVWARLLNALSYKGEEEAKKIKAMFQMSGWHSEDALLIYGSLKFLMLILGSALAWSYTHLATDMTLLLKIVAVLVSALLSSYIIDWVLRFGVNRHQTKIQKGFPDALDLMVICSEAGLGLNAIIDRVSKDVGQVHPDLGYELGILGIELNMLSSRKTALENFGNRLQSQLCKNMVGSLLQAEEYGTPMAQTMKTLSEEFRFDRLLSAEQRSAKLPVLMAGPLVLFIFPSLFIVILGPAIINVMQQFN